MAETRRENAELRLLDVLLEEELGGAQRASLPSGGSISNRSPARAWLRVAAVILSGLGVVAGTAWLRRQQGAAVAPTQAPERRAPAETGPVETGPVETGPVETGIRVPSDPSLQEPQGGAQEPQAVQPKDLAELRQLLDGVQKVVIRALPRPRAVPFLPDVPLLGRLFTDHDEIAASGDVGGFEPLTIEARDQRQAWVAAFRACEAAQDGAVLRQPELEVRLQLGGGRMLVATVDGLTHHAGDALLVARLPLAASAELRQLLDAAGAALQRACRRRLGIALDLDELRALPATATAVQCPCFGAADFRAELPRFAALERLALVEQGLSQLPTGETIAAIAAVATLRALELPADALTDADVAALAQLPLRELKLTGRLRNVTAAPFTRLHRLEALTLVVTHCEVDLRALLAALPVLRELRLRMDDWVDDLALDALSSTKIAQLWIGGSPGSPMGSRQLQRLAGIPSLRELHLHDIGIGPDELQALARMQSLRKLELSRSSWFQPDGHDRVDRAALQKLLPDCEVVEVPLPRGVIIDSR